MFHQKSTTKNLLTKISLSPRDDFRCISFSLLLFAAAAAALAAAIFPRVAMKRCMMPLRAGFIWNRGFVANVCVRFSDVIDGDGVIALAIVLDRTYRWFVECAVEASPFVDCPLTGLDDDEMPESSLNADTLSMFGSLSGVLEILEWPSLPALVLCDGDTPFDWLIAPPATNPPFNEVNIIFFSRNSRSRCSTSLISAWMRFNGSSFCKFPNKKQTELADDRQTTRQNKTKSKQKTNNVPFEIIFSW